MESHSRDVCIKSRRNELCVVFVHDFARCFFFSPAVIDVSDPVESSTIIPVLIHGRGRKNKTTTTDKHSLTALLLLDKKRALITVCIKGREREKDLQKK